MSAQSLSYAVFGICLVVLLVIIIGYYYARERHEQGEEVKYKMLEDDE